ncbi:MAG: MFS transporter [Solirubrobacteraceae bacterium]|nr:MFS transporter [Solirubrobacteraceae bacterium]
MSSIAPARPEPPAVAPSPDPRGRATAGGAPADSRRHHLAFWGVAYAFLVVMAFSAVPTPLYVLYQARDGWSPLTITLIFAVYAVGVVASLFLVGHLSDRDGRRRWMVPAIALNLISVGIFLAWDALPGLLLARFIGGFGVGALTATATAWITELHGHARPAADARRAQTVATAANLGGIGLGPLLAGALAQWAGEPLRTPYWVSFGLLVVALLVAVAAPETRPRLHPRPAYRPQRVAVPASGRQAYLAVATGAFVAFALLGLFNSLAPAFLAGQLHHTSRLLAGFAAFLVFAAAATAQTRTGTRTPRQILMPGLAALAVGPAVLVASVWLTSLPLFLLGAVVSGIGAGLTFKGAIGTAAQLAPAEQRAEALAGIFLAGYTGLAIPVIGLGLLTQELAADWSLTLFAALIIGGVALTASLVRRTSD